MMISHCLDRANETPTDPPSYLLMEFTDDKMGEKFSFLFARFEQTIILIY